MIQEQNAHSAESSTSPVPGSGVVVSLQICAAHRAPMQAVNPARALENLGLEGDRHAMPDGKRQVLLMPAEVLDKLDIPVGAVKENITTRGIDLMHLPFGTRLQIGEALFELSRVCEPCSRMDEIRRGLQDELDGQRGMLARVVRGGELRVGDEIKVIARPRT